MREVQVLGLLAVPQACCKAGSFGLEGLAMPRGYMSSILFGDIMVPQYRARFYPPFGV